MRLSDSQIRALKKLDLVLERCPYELQESRITLDSLVRLGLVRHEASSGALILPRIENYYRLTDTGERERRWNA